jgi:tetratricopeptide (TPR) repeat protein
MNRLLVILSRSQRDFCYEGSWRLALVAALVTCLVSAPPVAAQDEEEAPLPTLGKMKTQIPTMAELLTGDPVDWIILKSNVKKGDEREVLEVQPVYPRPGTIQKMAEDRDNLKLSARRPKQEAGESDEEYQTRLARLLDEATFLTVSLPEDPTDTDPDSAAEYRLNVARNVDQIVHSEDLMLMRADILLNEKKLDKAFELLLVVQRRVPGWPGYIDRRNRLLFEEAKLRMDEGQPEEALAFFEELHLLDKAYSGLREEMGKVIDALIIRAEESGELRQARYFLLRLRGHDASHPVATRWTAVFSKQTEELLRKAQTERAAGRHADAFALATEAAGVWPPHPQLRSTYDPIAQRYQILSVGVPRLAADPTPFFLPTDADRRLESLLATDLFQLRGFDQASFYESSVFEEWTPADLGRKLVFTLRRRRASWESNPVLTSEQVVRSIGDRLKRSSPYYDERLASFVRSMEVRSPQEFVLNFSSVPVRPQALLQFPVRQTDAPSAAAEGNDSAAGANVLSKRFVVHERADDHITFRRAIPQADRLSAYRVEEIVERKYPTSEKLVQALLRGDVSVLPRPPLWYVDELVNDDRFFLEQYGVPTTHVLQFNPESKPLRNAEFRRALANILDRQKILAETVLLDPDATRGRVVSAPFPRSSYGYDSRYDDELKQSGADSRDLPLAFSLAKFSEKRFGGSLPELKMVCEPGEVILAAAEQLVVQWAQLGIKVTIVAGTDQTPKDWDIVYRTVRMAEPVADLWPFLTMKPDARVEDLEHLPDWLRQQLIELEQSVDFNSSVRMLRGLHFRLNELVHIIPLWEVDDVIVIRKNIQGFPQRLVDPYHNVEKWKVAPWYSTELL